MLRSRVQGIYVYPPIVRTTCMHVFTSHTRTSKAAMMQYYAYYDLFVPPPWQWPTPAIGLGMVSSKDGQSRASAVGWRWRRQTRSTIALTRRDPWHTHTMYTHARAHEHTHHDHILPTLPYSLFTIHYSQLLFLPRTPLPEYIEWCTPRQPSTDQLYHPMVLFTRSLVVLQL